MPLIYALVAYKQNVQAEATTPGLAGNFAEVAKLLIKKLPATDSKLSYIYDSVMFHYICAHNWIYLCICDLKYQRMLAFQFLNQLEEFVKNPEASVPTPVSTPDQPTPPPSSPLQRFVESQMNKYNTVLTDKHHKLYSDISSLKDTMVQNIDSMLDRGERIDLLMDKSDALHETSFMFNKSAKTLKSDMWWKNTKLIVIIAGIAMFLLYLIISTKCGGMSWPEC